MLGVSNEKIKMFKIFQFPCYHGNQVGGVASFEKKPILGIFELLQPFPQHT